MSISNLFSGDAPRSLMTMSRVELKRGGSTQTRRAFGWFLTSPSGFVRSFTRTLGEIVKERWQSRRQVKRDLDPRVHRGWTFAVLRAVTNALLRDLNTALVAEEMRRGTRSIYVDYVDYDEIAHHAGMFRPESLAALDGLDRTLGELERLAGSRPRRYRIVVLSDHGQSQGAVFADRYGQTLADVCAELMDEHVENVDEPVEGLGRVDSMVGDIGAAGVTGKIATRAGARAGRGAADSGRGDGPGDGRGAGGRARLGQPRAGLPAREPSPDARGARHRLAGARPRPRPAPRRSASSPAWTPTAGVGDRRGGRHNLATGEVEGVDPLAPFGTHARAGAGCGPCCWPEAPDLYVNSAVDPVTHDVAAFEGLVGSHGGLGGWQDRACCSARRT